MRDTGLGFKKQILSLKTQATKNKGPGAGVVGSIGGGVAVPNLGLAAIEDGNKLPAI
jgi:hypothetical protein